MPRKPNAPASARIHWRCDKCRRVIADGKGYIHVDFADVKAAEEHARGQALSSWSTARQVVAAGGLAPWRVHHRNCDPGPSASGYWFGVESVRTGRALIEWTAHLMEKNWLPATDWSDLLYRITTNRHKEN